MRGATATVSAGHFTVGMGTVGILARLLSPSDFGIVTMVTTFSLLLRSVGLTGFTEFIMQREDVTDSLASNLFWINLGVGVRAGTRICSFRPLCWRTCSTTRPSLV